MISPLSKPSRRLLKICRPLVGCLLGLLVIAILRVSWLRWMDPVIDFGRELYIPWRILAGEHPGRDFVHLYGPFSAYFNAGLFATFGVAIHTLVVANLVIFAGIIVCLFVVTRRSFGFLPAAVAVAVAIPVFGFANYGTVNNYTYAAPYSHEATHGMLFLLLTLVWLGGRNGFTLRPASGFVAGLLFGLSCLTKTEYVLVAALLWATCLIRIGMDAAHRAMAWRWTALSAAGAASVFGVAWTALVVALSPVDAARSVANAFLAPFSYRILSQSPLGLKLLGADRMGENLLALVLVGLGALAVIGLIVLAGRRVAAKSGRAGQFVFLAIVLGAAIAGIVTLPWSACAKAFPGLLAGGMAWLVGRRLASASPGARLPTRQWNQVLFFLAAGGMLARMVFNPRVNHYGFYQALLAGAWVCGFLLGEWPRAAGTTRPLRLGLAGAMVVLLCGGAASLWHHSLLHYRNKDTPIGVGGDRIFGVRPDVNDLSQIWEQVRTLIVSTTAPNSTLLVVPEGISLNYWTRRRHPLRILDVLPATLTLNRRDVLSDLMVSPPDTVVLVSRDMVDFGYRTYGQDDSSGKALLEWIARNYTVQAQTGNYPFSPNKRGLWLMRRKNP